jgi:hypothetical protein
MSEDERRKNTFECDLCKLPGASEIVGGALPNNQRGLFFICIKCKDKIKDERKRK